MYSLTVSVTLRGVTYTPPQEPVFRLDSMSPPSGRRTSRIIVMTIGAVLLIALGAGGALAVTVLVGPDAFQVAGTVTLTDPDGYMSSTHCSGKGGYDDIAEGASVNITDAGGATVAIGRLGPGDTQSAGCVFAFSVADVPAGKSFYGIEISHRGIVKFSEAEVSSGEVAMTLG
jgi:hypothetical protein